MLQSRPETTAPAHCSTARETASPRSVGAMPQVRDLRRISALRRGFPAFACVAPLANVRGPSSFWPSPVRGSDKVVLDRVTEAYDVTDTAEKQMLISRRDWLSMTA